MSSTTPILLNSQIIGRAHYAARALLDRELDRTGTTFHQSMALNATAAEGGIAETSRIVELLTSTLKISADTAHATVAELLAAELIKPLEPLAGQGPRVALTEAGRAVQGRLAAVATEFGPRVYGGIPEEDLTVAGRVLTEVIARANAAYEQTADRY